MALPHFACRDPRLDPTVIEVPATFQPLQAPKSDSYGRLFGGDTVTCDTHEKQKGCLVWRRCNDCLAFTPKGQKLTFHTTPHLLCRTEFDTFQNSLS